MKLTAFLSSVVLSIALPVTALANVVNESCSQFVFYGAPTTGLDESNTQYLCRQNYAVHYRFDTKTAEWVAERITVEDISGDARRRNDFRADNDIPADHRASLADYARSGYDRGHMSPAAANTQTAEIMSESFLLTNMVPQAPRHNRGIWRILELRVNQWVEQGKDIYVINGTIYDQGYKTIGAGEVGVPTAMYKIIVDRSQPKAIAFLIPNTDDPSASELGTFAVTVRHIEELTGLDFHPELPEHKAHIETMEPNLDLWPGIE